MLHRRKQTEPGTPGAPTPAPVVSKPEFLLYSEPDRATTAQAKAAAAQIDAAIAKKYPPKV